MNTIYLQNTLSGEKEEFKPLKEGSVSMYACGPTVYDFAHIGNFRTFIFSDVLKRMFEYNGLNVDAVMNITDVDDKTIKRSVAEGVSLSELTKKYEDLFFSDLESLNIKRFPKTPRATESIREMISLIEKMLENGSAYKSTDGVYFDITKSTNYGKLANLNLENTAKERIANDEYDKANARDFSLWKFYSIDDGDVVYDAPFGKGRPGWHIECSAMSMTNLHAETIDIHTGGSDLIFPHHTNEIAQSEAVTGKKFVNYWMHAGFITVDGKKMSKSLGNIFTLANLKEKNIDPIAYRYFVLGAHYSTLLNFTSEAVIGAQIALKKLRQKISELPIGGSIVKTEFNDFINDDLNTPKALALIWDILKYENISDSDKRATILDFDKVLGLDLDKIENVEIPENVQILIKDRNLARKNKDFAKSDELRSKIESLGFKVMDTEDGTVIDN